MYDLVGIIIHSGGSQEAGHYYAYLRLAHEELGYSWFQVNDSVVRPLDESEVDAMCEGTHKPGVTPYILSYQCRQNDRASFAPRCACK